MMGEFFSSEARQRLVEYTLMCAVVGLITVMAIRVIDEQIVRMFAQINDAILGNIGQG